jgi:glycosyltransferase involved in cell wall biosynthesis
LEKTNNADLPNMKLYLEDIEERFIFLCGNLITIIAHILPWLTFGGVESATLRIAKGVEGEEFSSVAFLLPEADAVRRIFTAEGIETLTYQGIEPSYRRPLAFLRNSFLLARELKRKNISLVHCSDLEASYYVFLAGRLAGIPVLCHIRNRQSELLWRDKSFLYAINHFAFVSRDTWKHFPYKVSARRGTVIYDGIEVRNAPDSASHKSVRQQYNIPEDAKVIGMVARVAPQKDYATLIRAAVRVVTAEKNVRFLIVGEHSGINNYRKHYEEVKHMLAENNLAQYFIFTDFQSDVARFIDTMNIFVLSTHCEGLPLVILEAMAYGKPILATAVDGVPEIVVHEKTGLLHRHEDDVQLSEQILALFRNEEYRKQLGEAGQQSVKTDWSFKRFTKDMKNLYLRLLQK